MADTQTTETTTETTAPVVSSEDATAADAPDAVIENGTASDEMEATADVDPATGEDADTGEDVEIPADSTDLGEVGSAGVASNDAALAKLQLLQDISQEAVYLMGLCFILGVLFTVFALLILDFMRRNANDK